MTRNIRSLALLLLMPAALAAQSTFGSILGTVTDSTGAVVPGAKVTITNEGENISRSAATDPQGNYEVLNLKAGHYGISAEATGFKTFRVADLELVARQALRVNMTLEVGEVSETVRVEATAPVVTTDTQTIGSTFDTQQVLHLPANYRGAGSTSPLRLLAYQPGVQSDNSFNFSVQGALPSQTEISLDGISTIDVSGNRPLTELFPSAESVAEMKVQAVGNNAEFGQVGDITTTSRGGTNQFHGSAFDYLQNRAFDATAFGATAKPQKTANDFGGSIGGPVLKNRTFFFATFEDMQYRRGTSLQATVPTEAMRSGDFSAEGGIVKDPFTGQPFANNQIPSSLIVPVAPKRTELLPASELRLHRRAKVRQLPHQRRRANHFVPVRYAH